MRTIALTETIRTVTLSTVSTVQARDAKHNDALDGVLVFTGISLALAAVGIVFNVLNLPSPVMF